MRLIKTLLLIAICAFNFSADAQFVQPMGYRDYSFWGQVNIGNQDPVSTNASAILELKGTSKGFLAPRLTTTQRNAISGPATGLWIYNTTTGTFNYYNGTSWLTIDITTKLNISDTTDKWVHFIGMNGSNDSLIYYIGTHRSAIKLPSGGGGLSGGNLGSGYRHYVPGSQGIKTSFAGLWIRIDSTIHTNGNDFIIDSAALAIYLRSTIALYRFGIPGEDAVAAQHRSFETAGHNFDIHSSFTNIVSYNETDKHTTLGGDNAFVSTDDDDNEVIIGGNHNIKLQDASLSGKPAGSYWGLVNGSGLGAWTPLPILDSASIVVWSDTLTKIATKSDLVGMTLQEIFDHESGTAHLNNGSTPNIVLGDNTFLTFTGADAGIIMQEIGGLFVSANKPSEVGNNAQLSVGYYNDSPSKGVIDLYVQHDSPTIDSIARYRLMADSILTETERWSLQATVAWIETSSGTGLRYRHNYGSTFTDRSLVDKKYVDSVAAAVAGSIGLPSLADGKIWVGNGSAVATARTMSGDITMSNTAVTAIGANKVTYAQMQQAANGTSFIARAAGSAGNYDEVMWNSTYFDINGGTGQFQLKQNGIANDRFNTVATATFKGRNTAGTGNVEDLTVTQATALLNNMVGDAGSGGTKGLVPAPGSGDAAANKFLGAGASWAIPLNIGNSDLTVSGSGTTRALALGSTNSFTITGASAVPRFTVGTSSSIMYAPSASYHFFVDNSEVRMAGVIGHIKATNSDYYFYNDSAWFPKPIAYTGNIHGLFTKNSLIDKAYADSLASLLSGAAVASVTGTTNRITSTGGLNPVIDISSSYAGQASITTLGTIATGTWQGSVMSPIYGGMGVNNSTRTLTISNNSGTINFSGASKTLTVPLDASVSGTNTGDQTTVTGNAGTATALQNARTLWGQSFDGTGNVTGSLTAVTDITGGASNMVLTSGTGASRTLALRTTTAGSTTTTALTLAADQSATFANTVNATTFVGALTGNASTATALQNARTLWGQSFDGTGNITGSLTAVTDITGGASNMVLTAGTGASKTLALRTTTAGSTATTALTLAADQSATFANTVNATTFVGALTGNASTATTLATPRNIQGVSFNGSAAIDIINGTGFIKATGTTLSYDNSTYLTTSSAASTYQPLDADLTTISGLTPTTDNFMVATSSAWASRTPSQAKTSLALVKGDVGLGNVDNTSDATKNSATATLTNKRWTARVGSTTSSATPTINTDNVDIYKLTALAADITSFTTNLTGTPVDGDILEIQITGTATRAITWGTSFVASSVALPITTSSTTTLTVIFQYYSTSSYGTNKWTCVNSY